MASGDISRLRELFSYNCETGCITRNVSAGSSVAGSQVVSKSAHGYVRTKVDGEFIAGHRLAWALHYGEFPSLDLDHINGEKTDNRISNLREATRSQSQINRGQMRNNTSGFKGVNWNASEGKWMARCAAQGKRKHLGYFENLSDAVAAYQSAAKIIHGNYARQGE
jgi:hypothetical protein